MTIEALLVYGFIVGFAVGFAVADRKLGCVVLLAVPVAMIAYVSWWQGQNPDKIRSTSGLDFVFGPLWPSLGAIGGIFLAWAFRKQR
jgi:hypothetical protein